MMIDVDYLSRMHDKLVKNHTMLANAWSLADRAARPCAYKSTTLEMLLSKGKYSTKSLSPTTAHMHTSEASIAPPCKRQKVLSSDIITPRCSSPIHIHTRSTHKHIGSNWQHDSSDPILYCAEVQAYGWLSINRPSSLRFMAERNLFSHPVAHVNINRLGSTDYQNANFLSAMMPVTIYRGRFLPTATAIYRF